MNEAQENNSGLIAVLLIGILGVLIYQTQDSTPAEKIANSVGQMAEDVGNAIESNRVN